MTFKRGDQSIYRRLRALVAAADVELSRALTFTQSRTSKVLLDELNARSRRLSRSFTPASGTLPEIAIELDEERLVSNPGGWIHGFFWAYQEESIPGEFIEIINLHREQLEGYLGGNFKFANPVFYRTTHIPEPFQTYDVYSNVWHQDSGSGNRNVKIFLLVNDVSEDDGPMHYLSREATRLHWSTLAIRWEAAKIRKIPEFVETKRFQGSMGDYLMIDTTRHMHRAGIPRGSRDMVSMELVPEWTSGPNFRIFK